MSLLLPYALVVGWWELLKPDPSELTLSAAVQEMDAELAQAAEGGFPEILLIGSSHLGRGVDLTQLAAELGLKEEQLHSLWRSSMQSPHWYAMLENRIYAHDYQPKVVVVVSTLRRTLQVHVESDQREATLLEQMGEFEPVLDEKVFGRQGGGSGLLGLVKQRRNRLRDGFLEGIGAVATGFVHVDEGELTEGTTRSELGAARAEAAMDRLMGSEGAKDLTLQSRVIPIIEAALDVHEDDRELSDPNSTLVPDIIDLVQSNGGKVVFVDLPVSAREGNRHEVDPGTARAFIELLNARGAGFVDLHRMELQAEHFRDTTHLSEKGRTLATAALADALKDWNLLSPVAKIPPASMDMKRLLRMAVTRTGELPELPQAAATRGEGSCGWRIDARELEHLQERTLMAFGMGSISPIQVLQDGTPLEPFGAPGFQGDECLGKSWFSGRAVRFTPRSSVTRANPDFRLSFIEDLPLKGKKAEVWWIWPGSTLNFDFQGEQALADETVEIRAVLMETGTGSLPWFRAGAGEWTRFVREGSLLFADAEIRPGSAPWSIQIQAPEDGAYHVVAQLGVGALGGSEVLVGSREVELAEVNTLVRTGTFELSYLFEPPDLPELTVEPKPVTEHAGVLTVPELEMLSGTHVRERTLYRQSPVRDAEDGAPLPLANQPCLSVRKEGEGRYCHHDQRLFISSADGTVPGANGKEYSLFLDSNRRLGVGYWIYPGDVMTAPIPPARLQQLPGSVHFIRISGLVMEDVPPETPVLDLALMTAQDELFSTTILAGQLSVEGHRLAFPEDVEIVPGDLPFFQFSTAVDAPYVWVESPVLEHYRLYTGGMLPEGFEASL